MNTLFWLALLSGGRQLTPEQQEASRTMWGIVALVAVPFLLAMLRGLLRDAERQDEAHERWAREERERPKDGRPASIQIVQG